jgi:KDO2-lipid IV(A) lauroyltransferase
MLTQPFQRLDWDACRRVGMILGSAYYWGGSRRRALAIANIRSAIGCSEAQAARIARRSAQNWGMTTCEFLRQPAATPQEIHDYAQFDGIEHLHEALKKGKGAIVMMAHLGNWEVVAARLAQEVPFAAIMRPLSNAAAQEQMYGVRHRSGMQLISKHDAARPTLKFLRSGGAVCILPDRHAGPEGALLPLFGRLTRFETSPARFAVMSGAPIVPVFGVRREPWLSDGHIQARVFPAFSVEATSRDTREEAIIEGTKQVISCLENIVREHPDQWSWMLRRWRDDDVDPVIVVRKRYN